VAVDVQVTLPVDSATSGHRVVEPAENVTVPVGTPEPGATAPTVAEYVTDSP
jgi:hypothetical protein